MDSQSGTSIGSDLPPTCVAVSQQDTPIKPPMVRGRDRYLSVLRASGEISDRQAWARKRSVC